MMFLHGSPLIHLCLVGSMILQFLSASAIKQRPTAKLPLFCSERSLIRSQRPGLRCLQMVSIDFRVWPSTLSTFTSPVRKSTQLSEFAAPVIPCITALASIRPPISSSIAVWRVWKFFTRKSQLECNVPAADVNAFIAARMFSPSVLASARSPWKNQNGLMGWDWINFQGHSCQFNSSFRMQGSRTGHWQVCSNIKISIDIIYNIHTISVIS